MSRDIMLVICLYRVLECHKLMYKAWVGYQSEALSKCCLYFFVVIFTVEFEDECYGLKPDDMKPIVGIPILEKACKWQMNFRLVLQPTFGLTSG